MADHKDLPWLFPYY